MAMHFQMKLSYVSMTRSEIAAKGRAMVSPASAEATGNQVPSKYPLLLLFIEVQIIPYSRKIWRGIKFGGLAVYITTAKLKSAKISYSHIYVWRSHTEPPNLNPPIFLQ